MIHWVLFRTLGKCFPQCITCTVKNTAVGAGKFWTTGHLSFDVSAGERIVLSILHRTVRVCVHVSVYDCVWLTGNVSRHTWSRMRKLGHVHIILTPLKTGIRPRAHLDNSWMSMCAGVWTIAQFISLSISPNGESSVWITFGIYSVHIFYEVSPTGQFNFSVKIHSCRWA